VRGVSKSFISLTLFNRIRFHKDNFFLPGEIEVRTMILKDFFIFKVRTADFVAKNICENSHVRVVCMQTLAANI
jgi:hypothetical protein